MPYGRGRSFGSVGELCLTIGVEVPDDSNREA